LNADCVLYFSIIEGIMIQLIDVKTAARALSISPWTVRAYMRSGKLCPIKIGRRILLTERELERFVNERTTVPDPTVEPDRCAPMGGHEL